MRKPLGALTQPCCSPAPAYCERAPKRASSKPCTTIISLEMGAGQSPPKTRCTSAASTMDWLHGVPRIAGAIEQHLLDLRGVGAEPESLRISGDIDFDLSARQY
jgi:hypothetical protein